MPPSDTRPAVYVVIVDDDRDDLVLFERRLQRVGARVEMIPFTSSSDAADFFHRFAGSGFPWPAHTIIFCDVKMPGPSGFEILQQIRSCPTLTATPVYMISGANDAVDRKRLLSLGATGYLMKFPTPAELSSIVASATSVPPTKPVA